MSILGFFQKRSGTQESPPTEGLIEVQDELSLDTKDEELVQIIDTRLASSKTLWEQMKKVMDVNEAYWMGNQVDPTQLYEHQAKVIENRVFMASETVVPIIANRRRTPVVVPGQDTDESRDMANKVNKFLNWKYEEEEMDLKIEQVVRHLLLYRIGIFKYRWDNEVDDFVTEVVSPKKVIFDHRATNTENVEFVGEFLEDSLETLIEKFPKKKAELLKDFGGSGEQLGTLVKYLEFWTDEFVVTKVGKIILDKKKNPHWNWVIDPEKKEKNKKSQNENDVKNFFRQPKKPYVFVTWFSLGKSLYGDTDLIEQVRTLQDAINKRKRQISDSADQAAGILAASGDFISKEEFAKFTGAPDEKIWISRGNPNQAIVRLLPQPLANQVFQDLIDSKSAIDNVFGTHSTTRGERAGTETATGRQLLRDSDFGRIDLLVRNLDKRIEELYAGWVQMAKVFYDEPEYIRIMGLEGAHEFLTFSTDDIEDGVEIRVLSDLTADKATQREEAVKLMQLKLIDPLTFFEKMDLPNPKELTQRLVLYMADPKLYLAQFAMDENTPGTEKDPIMQAKRENRELMNGEEVPPFEGVTPEHLKIHTDEMQKGSFSAQEDDVKRVFLSHVRAENEMLKQLIAGAGGPAMGMGNPVQSLTFNQSMV